MGQLGPNFRSIDQESNPIWPFLLAAAAARSQIGTIYDSEPTNRNLSSGQGIFSRLTNTGRLNSLDDFMRSGQAYDPTNLTLQELWSSKSIKNCTKKYQLFAILVQPRIKFTTTTGFENPNQILDSALDLNSTVQFGPYCYLP